MIVHTTIAGITLSLGSSTHTAITCATQLATTSYGGSVSTKTITRQLPTNIVPILTTSHPTKSITPSPVTTTSTAIVTTTSTFTASTITDTFSTTSTSISTSTTTSTSTYVSTLTASTTTTTTVTSTVQPTAAITPIDQSSGDTDYVGSKRRAVKHPRRQVAQLDERAVSQSPKNACPPTTSWPVAVTCTDYIQVRYTESIILIGTTITKTAPTPTSTATITSTVTTVSTVVPSDVSTTLSFSNTITSVVSTATISTSIVSTTTTLTATTTTDYYVACGTSNILGPRIQDGRYLDASYYYSGQISSVTAASAYDCCVACSTTPGCLFSEFFDDNSRLCLNVADTSRTCSASYLAGEFFSRNDGSASGAFYYSNGYCGQLTDGGLSPILELWLPKWQRPRR
ncbi:hypothetical protein LTR78_002689 [Recurvomyces mirabilis]|uniref:Apple domain-containing protein n=1 Tax=Recurvomyces mirabilis TaxID=574656 RepID=A0AAE1C3V3_9PEZI|nr:hypothetical protein LTR78_002689 [Recurvomyces mirabilis]